MVLTGKETTQMVLDYQSGLVSFDDLAKKMHRLLFDCKKKGLARFPVIKLRVLEDEEVDNLLYYTLWDSAEKFDGSKDYLFTTYFYHAFGYQLSYHMRRFFRKKRFANYPMSLDYEFDEDGNAVIDLISDDGCTFQLASTEWFEVVKYEMDRHGFDDNTKQALYLHLSTGEPLKRLTERYGVPQVTGSRRLKKLRESLKQYC